MVKDFLIQHMMQHEDSLIYDEHGIVYTYKEFAEKALAIAHKMAKVDTIGRKCCILCESNLYTALGVWAAWEANMVPVPMSMQYGKRHCQNILNTIKPDFLITDFDEISISCDVFFVKKMCFCLRGNKYIMEPELEGVAVIMNTSGTTGKPKGVLIKNDGLIKNILGINEYFVINSRDTIIIARPLYHCAVFTGEFLLALYKGANIFFYSGDYNPMQVYSYIKKYNVSIICGTPTLLSQIARYKSRDRNESSIRMIALSGECLSRSVAHKIRKCFESANIYNVYGLTEASPRVSYLPPEMFDAIPESVGFPLKDIQIKIVNAEGRELQNEERGRICVQTPSIMKGYYKDTVATRDKFICEWLITGDIGYKDQNGRLYILGREDDMIIKAGMNIYPREIENLVNELEEIEECVAYGIPQDMGMIIGLNVVLSKDVDWDLKRLNKELSRKLPLYMLPKKVHIVSALCRNASGKILRREQ